MAVVVLPTPLQERAGGAERVPVEGDTADEGAYLTVLRQAFCDDGADPLGLWFGTESGTVFGSVDAGASWFLAAEHLPKITSVQAS